LDEEMLTLTLNGKKNITKTDGFIQGFNSVGLDKKQQENIIFKVTNCKEAWLTMILNSFLSDDF